MLPYRQKEEIAMQPTSVQKIAGVLNNLVIIAFICNLIALPLVPGFVYFRAGGPEAMTFSQFQALYHYESHEAIGNLFAIYLRDVWQQPYTAVLTLFLLFSGACTAIILLQALLVLESILKGSPFCDKNAHALRRAAVCGFLISAAALVRVVFSLFYYRSLQPLTTYNALFVPIFAMFGLLCLVMSALFRQAAELKAENDLTI